MCFKKILHLLFGSSQAVAKGEPLHRVYWDDAASTLAWSFRELFKHRGPSDQKLSLQDSLGWDIAQMLSEEAKTEEGGTAAFLEHPMRHSWQTDDPRIHEVSKRIDAMGDPVITVLWEIGTLRTISDLLTHLILREAMPGHLLWNTADYCKRHAIDLYAINDAYIQSLTNCGSMDADEITTFLMKVWPATETMGTAAEYYRYSAKARMRVTLAALQALGISMPLKEVGALMLSAPGLEDLQRQLECRAPDTEELRNLASYLDRYRRCRRPTANDDCGTTSEIEIHITAFDKALGPFNQALGQIAGRDAENRRNST